MAKAQTAKDVFLNFVDVSKALDAADSSTLVEGEVNTGLSIRGQLIWIVHCIEVFFADTSVASSIQELALCTVQGLASMPSLGDKGVICKVKERLMYAGAAFSHAIQRPQVLHYLPPIPLAAPTISLYAKTAADEAVLRGEIIQARIGFTTAPLDAAAYTEIAETWGW